MLRETNIQNLAWADKTMSVLRTRQLEACEKRLLALTSAGLFSDCDDQAAAALWKLSFQGQEHPMLGRMYSIQELRTQVMVHLPAQAALLSWAEEQLVERMLMHKGNAVLNDWEELDAAEALVRRLWCSVSKQDGQLILHLPYALCGPLACVLAAAEHAEVRAKLSEACMRIQSTLYIHGVLPAAYPIAEICGNTLQDSYACDMRLVERFLRTSYDYSWMENGDILLMHPGVADPMVIHADRNAWFQMAEGERFHMSAGGMLPEEKQLFDLMYGALQQAVRPELAEQEAVADLIMLCKQSVSWNELEGVLSTLLVMRPTERMRSALKALYDGIPRWNTLRTGMVQ